MANIQKLERMEWTERKLTGLGFIDQQRIKAMMLVWEVIEDNWKMFKDRISNIFGTGNRREKASTVIERVKRLLSEQGKMLTKDKEGQIVSIAENIAGESIDFYSFMTIKDAL